MKSYYDFKSNWNLVVPFLTSQNIIAVKRFISFNVLKHIPKCENINFQYIFISNFIEKINKIDNINDKLNTIDNYAWGKFSQCKNLEFISSYEDIDILMLQLKELKKISSNDYDNNEKLEHYFYNHNAQLLSIFIFTLCKLMFPDKNFIICINKSHSWVMEKDNDEIIYDFLWQYISEIDPNDFNFSDLKIYSDVYELYPQFKSTNIFTDSLFDYNNVQIDDSNYIYIKSNENEKQKDTLILQKDIIKYHELKSKWSVINNSLLNNINNPKTLEVYEKINELKNIIDEISAINIDCGNLDGIGLPGGPRDIVIIGAGPGGLAAAVMAGADGLDTLTVEKEETVGGQAKFSSRIENYPGFPIGISGKELTTIMYEQAYRFGVQFKLGIYAKEILYEHETNLKIIKLSNGELIYSRAVILACGLKATKLHKFDNNIIYGNGEKVALEGIDKNILIIGGSNGAAQAALGAAINAKHVSILSRSPIVKGMSEYQILALQNHPKITIYENDEIDTFENDHIITKNGVKIDCDVCGAFLGGNPDTKWLPDTLIDKDGKIIVNTNLETLIPGVFACGDIKHGSLGRVGAAVGDGQLAENGVFKYFSRIKNN